MRFPRSVSTSFACAASLLVSITIVGCGSDGNTGKVSAAAPPIADAEGLPIFPRIAGGLEEPLNPETNQRRPARTPPNECARAAELAFTTDHDSMFMTFEAPDVPAPAVGQGLALAWGAFDDLTQGSFLVPKDFSDPDYFGLSGATAKRIVVGSWGLPSDSFPGPSCDFNGDGNPDPNGWSLHVRGGQFKDFGGGAGHAIGFGFLTRGSCTDKDYCPPEEWLTASDPHGLGEQATLPPYLDMTKYEGIAFWARKGPEGQPTLLVNFTDKYTSDDLNRGNQRFCRRLKQCQLRCSNGNPCVKSPASDDAPIEDPKTGERFDMTRCIAPEDMDKVGPAIGTARESKFPRCGVQSACTFNQVVADPDFEFETTGATCQHYAFSGDEGGDYCVVPDQKPPGRAERCGDGWAAGVHLTDEWKFYTVPFSELRQGGYGKAGPYLDLKTLFSVTMGWGAGWVDMYIDNVTFYRRKTTTPANP